MISGMRKAPPISISSPRETIASRPLASVLSTSRTAAALLLTTVASSAPVSSQSRSRIRSSRSPRWPAPRSNSSATALRIATCAAAIAASAHSARPRLVCSTVPVRLNTGRGFGRCAISSRVSAAVATCSEPPGAAPLARAAASVSRTAVTTAERPNLDAASAATVVRNTSSTDGSLRNADDADFAMRASITEQERIDGAAPVAGLAQQDVEPERRDVVGDGFELRIFVLVQNLQVAVTAFAGLRLDRVRSALEFLIGDARRGFAKHAFYAHHVPLRRAQRAGAEPRAVGTLPAEDRRSYRRAAARRAEAVADRH